MDEPAFRAFQEVALTHQLPQQLAFDHLEGFAMDAREERYACFGDTLRYCYHVAGVVGLMMARVMGVRDERVLDHACDLGLAFQLTNIARDIVEDAENGRCYLPQSWLDEAGLSAAQLADPQHRAALAPLQRVWCARLNLIYQRAASYGLPLRSAWAIATARGVYREIGVKCSMPVPGVGCAPPSKTAGAAGERCRRRASRLAHPGRVLPVCGSVRGDAHGAGAASPAACAAAGRKESQKRNPLVPAPHDACGAP